MSAVSDHGWAIRTCLVLLAIAIVASRQEAAQQLGAIVVIPVFLSGALVPTATMPSWLRVVTANQPVTQAIDTLRALFSGQPAGSHLPLALAEFAGISLLACVVAAALFRRAARG
ncbi:MAG TPA: ABC transporter permease [Streptosporangiaceae bacterium]